MSSGQKRIGVLALQGAFELHRPHLESLGAEYVEVVRRQDFDGLDGLILPGGESGALLKLIDAVGVANCLLEFLKRKPAWGICAGAILMAKAVHNPSQFSFGVLDVEIERNAYGRQLESSHEWIDGYGVSYIRAPRILRVGPSLKTLAERDGSPTWVESDSLMVTSFHPETNLSFPSPWHRRLFEKARSAGWHLS